MSKKSKRLLTGYLWAGLIAAAPGAEGMIVGGKSILIDEAPWQLVLRSESSGCGASWIGGRWVLTAAHCVNGKDAAQTYVWAGITDNNKEMTNANRVAAKRIIVNPTYADDGDADLALIELNADVTQVKARPVALATPAHDKAGLIKKGVMCMASGWGYMNTRHTLSPDTLRAVISAVNDTSRYSVRWAGNGVDSVGSCMGDSGGPLVVKDANGQWILAGVSSTIPGGGATLICGDPNGAPWYARVSVAQAWIVSVTGTLPTGVLAGPDDARISFPAPGQFRLVAPGVLETALFNMAGARVAGDRRFYAAGTHALPSAPVAGGRYVLRIRGSSLRVTRALSVP